MRNNGRKAWVLLLVLLAGVLIGGVAWLLLAKVWPGAAGADVVIGTASPWTVNLSIIDFTLGLRLHVNPGSAVGLILGLVIYFWKR